MLLITYLVASLGFLSSHSVVASPTKIEHPNSGLDAQGRCVTDVLYEGTPVGHIITVDDTQMYVSEAKGPVKDGQGILFLPDVLGLAATDNLLLADSFAREGYFVLAVDLYQGKPAPGDHDIPETGFNVTQFLLDHTTSQTDPLVELGIRTLRSQFGIKRVATAAYCFGAKYAFRFATAEKRAAGVGVDVLVAAHITNVTDSEIKARVVPASVAFGQFDALMPKEKRWTTEEAILATSYGSAMDLYSDVPHGFAIRVNVSDPVARFVKQEVFTQHVTWLNYWMPQVKI